MTKTVTLTIKTTRIGKVLADAKGDTVYWYSKDMKGGPSTCTGGCLTAWPVVAGKPIAAMGVVFAGKLGSVTDPGGMVQATYNGYPLYTYSGDMAPGETAGNGAGGVWHVIAGQYLTATSSGSGSMGSSGSGSSGSGYGSGYGSGAKMSGSPVSSGSASKGSSYTSSTGTGSASGMGSSNGMGSGSTGGTGSTGASGSNSGSNPAPAPTSSINGGGCGSGACW